MMIARIDGHTDTASPKPRPGKGDLAHADAPARDPERSGTDFAAQVRDLSEPDAEPAATAEDDAPPPAQNDAAQGEAPDATGPAQPSEARFPGIAEDASEQPGTEPGSEQVAGLPVPPSSGAGGAHGVGRPGDTATGTPSGAGLQGDDDPERAKRPDAVATGVARSHAGRANRQMITGVGTGVGTGMGTGMGTIKGAVADARGAGDTAPPVDDLRPASLSGSGDSTARFGPVSRPWGEQLAGHAMAAAADHNRTAPAARRSGMSLSLATDDRAEAPEPGGRASPLPARVPGTNAPQPAPVPGHQQSLAGTEADPASGLSILPDTSPARDTGDPTGVGAALDPAGPSPTGRGVEVAPGRAEAGRMAAAQVASVAAEARNRPVEIALHPEELGRVRIAMSATETGMTLSISAERPETVDLMRRHIDQLTQEFRRLGYSDIGFDFGQGDAGWTMAGQHREESAAEAEPVATPVAAAEPMPDTSRRGALAEAAGSAALDLRL